MNLTMNSKNLFWLLNLDFELNSILQDLELKFAPLNDKDRPIAFFKIAIDSLPFF